MVYRLHRSPFRLLFALLAASLAIAACGDDTSDATSDTNPDDDPVVTSTPTSGEPEQSGETEDATGTLTVDDAVYSFEPTLCLPDEAAGSSVSGAGTAEDGTDIYVDMAAGNLMVYLGTDDPFSADPDLVASSIAGQGSLEETVDGSTLRAAASFAEHEATEVVAEGSLEVTC